MTNFKIELPVCPTCEAQCTAWVRTASGQERDTLRPLIDVPDGLFSVAVQLQDIIRFSCGAVFSVQGRRLTDQPEGANGYEPGGSMNGYEQHAACTEAERIVRELREKQQA